MKQVTLATSLFISSLLLSSATFAQMSLKGEAAPAPYNWTGFYAGVNAGVVYHNLNLTDVNAAAFNATITQNNNPKFAGGLQLGYRRQLDLTNVSGVYGLEFTADFANAQFEKEYGSNFSIYQLNSEHTLKDILMLQLIGGIAADRTLLFLAAGLSWVNITGTTTNLDTLPFFDSFSVTKKQWGTSIGVGIEYAITCALSARFKVDVIAPNTYSVLDDVNDSFQVANHIVLGTLGIDYKFA